jgi:DNA invertase Pin-like site-specific DNA recombinase
MSKTDKPAKALMFGYTRCSTEDQVESRNGLEAQRAAIDAAAECRGWAIEHFADEGKSGKYVNTHLREALELLACGQGNGLVVTKLDRLARSVIHASEIIERANQQGWSLVVLDMKDGSSPNCTRLVAAD